VCWSADRAWHVRGASSGSVELPGKLFERVVMILIVMQILQALLQA
jgi:hypothetical protein